MNTNNNLIITLALLCIGCAPKSGQAQSIDPAFSQYLVNFEAYGASQGVSTDDRHLVMSFSKRMPSSVTIGYCDQTGPTVVIYQEYWNGATLADREQLVFHELGHCLLGLQHDDSKQPMVDATHPERVPIMVASRSIMNTYHFDMYLYGANRDFYIKELFNSNYFANIYWNRSVFNFDNQYNY